MKILLLGEYSNVHHTLADGLRQLGHKVVVASDGDGWKNYPRDVDLHRSPGWRGTAAFAARLLRFLPQARGFDVVQIINPVFLELKSERLTPIYHYLRRHNGSLFLGAFGIDAYWVATGMDCHTFRYSDFNLGPQLRHNDYNTLLEKEWISGHKGQLNRLIAEDCDGIVAGLYEYWCCYRPAFPQKTAFIPLPIDLSTITPKQAHEGEKMRCFIGIQTSRHAYKGTDILLRGLETVARQRPDECEIVKAESVPFALYQNMMNTSDVLLDQLYGYTPCMNALLAMAKGLVVMGGGEPEGYDLLGEKELRPVVNVVPVLPTGKTNSELGASNSEIVAPNSESVERELHHLLDQRSTLLPRLSRESRAYVAKHHDHVKVARQYLNFWIHAHTC